MKCTRSVKEVSLSVLESRFNRAVRPKARLWAMIRLGEGLIDKDATQAERAVTLFSEAYHLAESVGDRRGIAAAIHGTGSCQLYLSNFTDALKALKHALPIAEQTGDVEREIKILQDIGQVYGRRGSQNLALEMFGKCAELAELIKNPRLQAFSLNRMGNALMNLGQIHESLEYHAESLTLLEHTGSAHEQAIVLQNMSNALMLLGKYTEAFSALEQSIQLFHTARDSRNEGLCQVSMGLIYLELGDYPNALFRMLTSAKILEHTNDKLNLAKIYANLMDVYSQCGNKERAKDLGEKALIVFNEIGDKLNQAGTLSGLGECYFDLGKRGQATRMLKRSLLLSREVGSKDYEAAALIALAKLESNLGNFSTSEKLLQDALAIASTIDDQDRTITALLGLGSLFNKRAEPDQALPVLERAITIAVKIYTRPYEREAHQMLAEAFEMKGDFERALTHWKLASSIKEEMLGVEKQKAITAIQIRAAIEKSEQEKAILRKETKSKSQEIERIAMSLTEKNEVIRKIVKFRNRGERSQLNKLLSDLEHGYSARDKSTALLNEFQLVHRDILQKLSNRFPALSSTESKICVLLRDGLSTKQMADMLKVTPRAVEKHRYAIRKKMKLGRETSLTTMLSGL